MFMPNVVRPTFSYPKSWYNLMIKNLIKNDVVLTACCYLTDCCCNKCWSSLTTCCWWWTTSCKKCRPSLSRNIITSSRSIRSCYHGICSKTKSVYNHHTEQHSYSVHCTECKSAIRSNSITSISWNYCSHWGIGIINNYNSKL